MVVEGFGAVDHGYALAAEVKEFRLPRRCTPRNDGGRGFDFVEVADVGCCGDFGTGAGRRNGILTTDVANEHCVLCVGIIIVVCVSGYCFLGSAAVAIVEVF